MGVVGIAIEVTHLNTRRKRALHVRTSRVGQHWHCTAHPTRLVVLQAWPNLTQKCARVEMMGMPVLRSWQQQAAQVRELVLGQGLVPAFLGVRWMESLRATVLIDPRQTTI